MCAKIYVLFTDYELKMYGDKESSILMLIAHERCVRHERIELFRELRILVEEVFKGEVFFLEVRRRLTMRNILNGILCSSMLFNRNFIDNVLFRQIENRICDLNLKNRKKVVVHCDTAIFQNYLVELANELGLSTFSIQHAFYPTGVNGWKDIYYASNSKCFFAWDEQTRNEFERYSTLKGRRVLVSGVIRGKIRESNFSQLNDKDRPCGKKTAIYLLGPDQEALNLRFVEFMQSCSVENQKFVYIAHPRFNFFSRMKFSRQAGVKVEKNSKKNNPYVMHVVFRSTVRFELIERGERVLLLDEFCSGADNFDRQSFISMLKECKGNVHEGDPSNELNNQLFFAKEIVESNFVDSEKYSAN